MKTKIIYFFFALLLVFASCENRDWDNPFDPDCPKELFTPANFTAKQEGNLVKLTWTQSNTQISGFVIERSIDGGAWSSVATPSKTELTWSDNNITGGKEHKYRLVAKAGSNSSDLQTAQVTLIFAPTITTNAVAYHITNSATCGGNIINDGGSPVNTRGVCWSTSRNPTIANSKTTDGIGTGSFTSNISGLTENSIYYVRAYATNQIGTSYGNEELFIASSSQIIDIDKNIYNIITIGTQVWLKENLKTTKYNDGSAIPLVTGGSTWANLTTPGYCWYNNDATSYKNIYGALYNWYTVNTGKLCPTGWHVPTDSEWTTLSNYLGGNVAGGKMKATSEWSSNGNGTNTSGFSAVPGGFCNAGNFVGIGEYGFWWCSPEYSTILAWHRYLFYDTSYVYREYGSKGSGFSVRCVRD